MLFAAYADCHMFEKAVPIENKMTWGCAILDTATAFKHKKESQNKGAFFWGHLNQDFKKLQNISKSNIIRQLVKQLPFQR